MTYQPPTGGPPGHPPHQPGAQPGQLPAPAPRGPAGPGPYGAPAPGPYGPYGPPGQVPQPSGFGGPPPGFGGPPPGGTPAFGPPQPGGNRGAIIAIVCGVVAILAIAGLVVALSLNSGSSDQTAAAASTSSTTPDSSRPSTPDSSTPADIPDPAETIAIRDAMQTFIDARNSRDLTRMKAAVCSQDRDKLTAPKGESTVVFEALLNLTIDGDVAESQMLLHYELGTRRTESEQSDAKFLKESDRWYFCPGAEPEIAT